MQFVQNTLLTKTKIHLSTGRKSTLLLLTRPKQVQDLFTKSNFCAIFNNDIVASYWKWQTSYLKIASIAF